MEFRNEDYSIDICIVNAANSRPQIDRPAMASSTRMAVVGLIALVSTSTGHTFFGQPDLSNPRPMVRTVQAFSAHAELPSNFSADLTVQVSRVDHSAWMTHTDYARESSAAYVPLTAKMETTVGGELVVTNEDRQIISDIVKSSTADLHGSIRELAAEIRGLRDVLQTEVKRLDQGITGLNKRLDDMKSSRQWVISTFIAVLISILGSAVQIALHFIH